MKGVAVLAAVLVAPRQALGSRMMIINGTIVPRASPLHAEFALPTNAPDTDAWLGCGASIISPTFAMTSAHCFGGGDAPCSGPTKVGLWVGDVQLDEGGANVVPVEGGHSFRVDAELVCNPAFDGKCSHGNDMALLKLTKALPSWVKPVKLNLDRVVAAGETVSPLGFGMTESADDKTFIGDVSQKLRKVTVTALAQDADNCARVFAGGFGCSDPASEGQAENLNMQICAGSPMDQPADACAGDSGSPVLADDGTQIGLVSYGGGPGEKRSGPARMCGDPNFPGIYAQVSAFKSFILDNVHDLPSSASAASFLDGDNTLSEINLHLRGSQ